MTPAVAAEPRPFDTSEQSLGEATWLPFFATAPRLEVRASSILVVSPHPDDETLAAGGLMRAAQLRGARVRVVSVTDGENARAGEPDLAFRRRAELAEALDHLSASTDGIAVTRLGLPDGDVRRYEGALTEALMSLAASHDLIVGPLECDGHTDHEAVGRACLTVARHTKVTLARYPIWAWYRSGPQAMASYEWRRFELDAGLQRCKARAVQCFRSQLEESSGAAVVPPHVLQYFRRPFEAFAFSRECRS